MRLTIYFLFITILAFPNRNEAQSKWELMRTLPISNIQELQLDRFGNLYVVDKSQNITKYDSLGKQLEIYSSPTLATVSQLQVTQSVNVFIFYEDAQKAVLMDRFLGNEREIPFEDPNIGYVTAACLSNDNNIWLFDQSELSLKKYSPRLKEIIFSLPLNFISSDLGFTRLEERNNKLFAFSSQSVYVFNALGNLEAQREWEREGHSGIGNGFIWHQDSKMISTWKYLESGSPFNSFTTQGGNVLALANTQIYLQNNPLNIAVFNMASTLEK